MIVYFIIFFIFIFFLNLIININIQKKIIIIKKRFRYSVNAWETFKPDTNVTSIKEKLFPLAEGKHDLA